MNLGAERPSDTAHFDVSVSHVPSFVFDCNIDLKFGHEWARLTLTCYPDWPTRKVDLDHGNSRPAIQSVALASPKR
ncbi:MAG: hypothetical protein AMXMBFR6_22290 [Betaproteobacteria bacterium]